MLASHQCVHEPFPVFAGNQEASTADQTKRIKPENRADLAGFLTNGNLF